MRSQNHKPLSRGLAASLSPACHFLLQCLKVKSENEVGPPQEQLDVTSTLNPIAGLCEDIKWVFSVSACGQESARNRCFRESGLVTIQENKVFWLKVMQCQSNTGRRKNSKNVMELLKRDWVLPDVNSQCLLTYLSVILFEKYLFIWLYWIFGEGNGTPLQYSCLENPMDRRAC